ncbi:Cytochrome c554 and c-prime [Ferrimonas sediminum]|uniref:Cytochrome c554 and c-prime n=1 Tax=Ferrimonas sediminum TaxID=718193 RepID=A0A1G8M6H6_9GAMM|nr:cadherin-like domain-containing protein [Ferrimonas sediminum]SDI63559.1 Cytochrome c554 and c-prime [Ferrimonas sediminum]
MKRKREITSPAKTLVAAMLISVLSACDSGSGDSSSPQPSNAAPIANPVEAMATMGSRVLIDALENDLDSDGDELTIEAVSVMKGAGNVSIHNNKIMFDPVEIGTAILSYSISDGNGGKATSTVTVVVSAQELAYVGSQACLSCHTDKESYLETGHNYKLVKVNGKEPEYPFTSISGSVELLDVNSSLGNPTSWDDISYVVGGYLRRAYFLDQNGYMLTGKRASVNSVPKGETVTIDRMNAWNPDAPADSKQFDYCARCHTTGWKDYTSGHGDERNLNRQDDMPGMAGTFALTGVQCEACHGAGLAHIKSPSKDNIVKIAEPRTVDDYNSETMGFGKAIACTECHTTDDAVRRYPDYVSPHDQEFGGDSQNARLATDTHFGPEGRKDGRGGRHAASTLLGVDPDTGIAMGKKQHFNCSTCHNPHKSKHYDDKPGHEDALARECTDCHKQEFNNAPGSNIASAAHEFMAKCTDCHMPGESHLFKIDLDGAKDDPRHFSADGDYQKPWLRAWDSCSECHADDYDERAKRIGTIHK